ncbi:MAG: response regulator, partial [Deltaproteobacteria bacterium]|nr:response regulator [Deltaproteobacteria bacterium]
MDLVLTDQGYTVFTAADGGQALEIFRTVMPSIVLTDIKMPVMDGIELLRRIKQESPDTEVIMITGHGDMELAIKSIKQDATDFITKPINNDALEIALKRAHDRISMRQEIRRHTENLEMLVREQSAKLVEAERLAAVGQVVEGLPSAMKSIMENFGDDLRYFNDLPCFVAIHNSDLDIVATNQLYKEKLGDRTGHKSWDIYTNQALDISACPVSRTFATGVGQSFREKIKGLQNEIPVIVHTAPIRNSDQGIELVLEVSVDVTEVQHLQEELRTTQQRFRQLFEEAPCYITVQDRDLRLTEVNRRFREDFGDELGSYCYETYKHRGEPCSDCPILSTFEDGNPAQAETVVTSKTGDQYNVLIWTAPVRNAAGETTHVMEMSTNITQIRKLQDQLSSLGLLIGSISHGIKGLLTALDGGMYRVDSGLTKNNPALVQSGWETVQLTVDRIKSLVLNILYYAKERELAWERVDPLTFGKNMVLM